MAIIVPQEVQAVLADYDSRQTNFSELGIPSALKKAFKPTAETPQELRSGFWAESAAFSFSESPSQELSKWGTYFGPLMSATRHDGSTVDVPDINKIDGEVIDYWKKRAHESKHPVLKARYADLVWDFLHPVTLGKSERAYAEMAIDAYSEMAYLASEATDMQSRRHLERALELAISLNDQHRIVSIKQAMFKLYERIAEPNKIGTWTFLFDSLYGNKKIVLTDAERNKIVTSLEEILRFCSDIADKEHFDPWASQGAAERLEKHYQAHNQAQKAKDAILVAGKSFEAIAAEADSLVAMTWLQDVYEAYQDRGLATDAVRVQKQSQEKGKGAKDSMREIIATFQISTEQLDQFFANITSGTFVEALHKIANNFIPKIEAIKINLESLKQEHPLQAMLQVRTISNGQLASKTGSVDDDPDGRLRLAFGERISVSSLFLSETLDRVRIQYSPTAEQILEHVYQSPLFDPDRRELLFDGIHAYLLQDHLKAIHILVPQIEHILRRTLSLHGQPTNKSKGKGVMQEKNINDALQALARVLPEDFRLYLLMALAEPRGLNIRHNVSHGLIGKSHFNQQISDLLINILLCLAEIMEVPTAEKTEADDFAR